MSKQAPETSREELEKRRSKTSQRHRTPLRNFYYFVGLGLLKFFVRLLWWSYRLETVIGEELVHEVRYSKTPYAPCLWHGQLVLGTWLAYQWVHNGGYKACFVVSPSVDGDVPSKLGEDFGAKVIRGSSNSSGARVLRDMKRMFREGYSVITAADGPTGPNRHFKEGVALMAKVLDVPMVPIAFAADRAWYLRRWDSFMIPKPFAKIVVSFGEPIRIPKETSVRELEPWREKMESAVNALEEQSKQRFGN